MPDFSVCNSRMNTAFFFTFRIFLYSFLQYFPLQIKMAFLSYQGFSDIVYYLFSSNFKIHAGFSRTSGENIHQTFPDLTIFPKLDHTSKNSTQLRTC